MSMSPDHEMHLEALKGAAVAMMDGKYRQGQAEHGGNLWEKSDDFLLDAAIFEAVDQLVYLLTLRNRTLSGRR